MSILRVRRSLFSLLLLAAALPGGPVLGAGDTFYVSPTGDDDNSCTSTLPCREIRRALELVGPGDTILVANGSYKGFDVSNLHGQAGSPITIRAQGANAAVVKTTDRSDNRDTIFITNSSYVVVDGLRSFGANRAAVRVDWSPRVTIRNCVFGNNATWGIFTDFSNDLLIENNETYGSVSQHGIYVSNSGDRPVVRGNRSHDNKAAGIHVNGDVSSGGDGIITGALIENNVIYNNGTGGAAGINMDGVQDSTIRNNLIYNNHASGITLYQIDGAQGPKGNKVYHNTVHQASDGRWALLIWRSWGLNTVRNNVLYHPNSARGGINYLSNVDVNNTNSDYNILDRVTPDDGAVYTLAQWQLHGHEKHSFSAPPSALFVNPAGGDYRLAAGSPAINRGQTLVDVTKDILGTSRPIGTASDISAHEAGLVPSPILSVTPTSLAFGSVTVGSTRDLTVTVKNAGGGTLTGSASTTAPFAVVGTASYSLAANQTKIVTVRFSPTVVGAASRTLSLTGGGGGSVSLGGTGATTTPKLSVTPSGLAFGSITVGSIKYMTVTVKNAGGGTLTGAASTTSPFGVVGTASYSLAANQTKVLTVRFSPTASGAASRTLTLTGGGGGSVSLSGTGVTPTPKLSVTPSGLAFGSVPVGSTKNMTVTVKNIGGGTLTGAASTTSPFGVVGTASYSLAANQTKILTVRFSPTVAGAASRTLTLTGGGGGFVSLSGTGITTPKLSVTPSGLAFGSVPVGSTKNMTVTVKNIGGGTLTGAASTTAPFGVVGTASYSLAANQTKILTVRFSPTAAGAASRTLTLTGGGGGSVSLGGTGVTTPKLSFTPSSLSFGGVAVGSTKNMTVTVKNIGGGTLTGAASTTAPFAVVGTASYSLAANQTKVLTVRFSPKVAGAASKTLTLTGGGGGSVPLSGRGGIGGNGY